MNFIRLSRLFTLLVAVALLPVFGGCEGYSQAVRDAGHSLGTISPRDLHQADAYRQVLPEQLKLPANQIEVQPGSGITEVTISGVSAGADQDRIASKLRSLNEQNPQMNPLKWTFR